MIAKGPATGEAVEPAAMAILLSSRVGNERECLLQNIEQKKKEWKAKSTDESKVLAAEMVGAKWEDR